MRKFARFTLWTLLTVSAVSAESDYKTIGSFERHDPRFDELFAPDARIEVIADGFSWAEGPLWLPTENCLIFSDVPENTVWRWDEESGATKYLVPSGSLLDEPGQQGSNGLVLSPEGDLMLCQHGMRQVAMMDAPLDAAVPKFKALTARNHEGKRYNSPNDACYHKDGSFYFTDPPYGLPGGADDESRETDYSGVYRVSKEGEVTLIDDELERPNGIALSPDQKTLYVANSHQTHAIWMAYALDEDGTVKSKEVFVDVTKLVGSQKGMPDGLKVHDAGYLFATAPGGVWVFDSERKHLGTILTEEFASNVAFSADQKTLYITADMMLLRVKLK